MLGKADKIYNFVKGLKDAGCPIHGVGFQAHFQYAWFHNNDKWYDALRSNIKRYADLGIIVHISEIDVECKPNAAQTDCETPWTNTLREEAAVVYEKIF